MKKPFESIVIEHGATVLRVCRAVVGPVDADDAWSETFLAALQHYPSLPAQANVQAWLVTIAHRKSVDLIRKNAKVVVQDRWPERADRATAMPPGEPIDPAQLGIWETVKLLPQRQRQAVAYRFLGGLSFAEIAELTGGTTAAARRACADGLNNLRTRHITAFVDYEELEP